MLRVTLGHQYDVRRDRSGDAFGIVVVQPTPNIRFRSDVSYDPVVDTVPSATADISVVQPYAKGSLGIRYSEPGKITFLQAAIDADLVRWLSVRSSLDWDLYRSDVAEARVAANFHWQCWALTVEYVHRADRNDEVRFAVNLLGVGGPIGTSVGLGALESTGAR